MAPNGPPAAVWGVTEGTREGARRPAILARGDGGSDQAGGHGEEQMDLRCVLVVKSKDLGCPRYSADGEGGTETKFSFLTCAAG